MTTPSGDPTSTILPLSERCTRVRPSATAELFGRVADMRASGQDVLGLHVGEPDFDTPPHIVRAAQEALAKGATRYTPVRGIAPLREAICADSARRRGGITHEPAEVVVSVGAKQSLFNLSLALFGPGDEVIIPSPCWVSYPDQVRLAGATPVMVATARTGFKLTPEGLRSALGPRTRGLLLCSPSNPTGACYSLQELSALAKVVRECNLWVIVDEIYSELVYDGFEHHSWLQAAPDLRDRTILVDGVSKRFAMTGFRLGWSLAPLRVSRACEMLQGQSTTSAATVSQQAALAALHGPDTDVVRMREAYAARRSYVLKALAEIPGLRCRPPEGAFYAFVDVHERLRSPVDGAQLGDDVDLARVLLERQGVAVVPGTAFLAPGFLRLSFAASDDTLAKAMERLADLLA